MLVEIIKYFSIIITMNSILKLSLFILVVTCLGYFFLLVVGFYDFVYADAYLYFLFSFLCLLFGIKLGNPNKENLKIKFLQSTFLNLNKHGVGGLLAKSFSNKERFLFRFLCFLGLVAGLLIVINMGGVNVLLSRSLQETRSQHIHETPVLGSTPISSVIMICLTFSLIGSCFITLAEKNTIVSVFCIVFHVFGFSLFSISNAGRISIILSILPVSFTIFVKDQFYKSLTNYSKQSFLTKVKNNLCSPLIAFLIFLFLISTVWSYLREVDSYSYVLKKYNYDVLVSASLFPDNEIGNYLSYFTTRVLSTFTNGIYSFSPFYNFYDEPPTMGVFQFSNALTEKLFANDWQDWIKIKEKVEYTYFLADRSIDNVWGTSVREFIVDFGVLLTPLFLFLFGYFIGFSERNCFKSKALLGLYVMNLMWMSMSIFYSLFIIRPFQVAYIILFILYMAELCFSKRRTIRYLHNILKSAKL